MAISRVNIKDFLVFKGEFATDFSSGVNVLIGGNGTGKTTLLKVLYWACEFSNKSVLEHNALQLNRNAETPYRTIFTLNDYFMVTQADTGGDKKFISTIKLFSNTISSDYPALEAFVSDDMSSIRLTEIGENKLKNTALSQWCKQKVQSVFIPVTEMLQHSKGFLALERERQIPFDKTQIDILSKAELGETHEITPNVSKLLDKIKSVIMGEVVYENDTFFTVKADGRKIPFSLEASGYQKFGLLWKLLRNGLLENGSVLFWDEPEASINPELMSVLVEILLELQRGGVQIFLATHSEILASYFDVKRKDNDSVMFYSLYKNGEQIKADKSEKFGLLEPNFLTAEQVKLYKEEVKKVMKS
ncbi:AAA ATPase [Candidatus Symbiothrix dinenymphae]|nr:AAA ATPase [Candidatus Symbiothrix dinenymphae]